MSVNAKSIFLTARHVVPIMKRRGSGSIVNIASIAGVRARPGLNAYCASKGAAIQLTLALALELAPYQVRVNAINPGPSDTPMLGGFLRAMPLRRRSIMPFKDVLLHLDSYSDPTPLQAVDWATKPKRACA